MDPFLKASFKGCRLSVLDLDEAQRLQPISKWPPFSPGLLPLSLRGAGGRGGGAKQKARRRTGLVVMCYPVGIDSWRRQRGVFFMAISPESSSSLRFFRWGASLLLPQSPTTGRLLPLFPCTFPGMRALRAGSPPLTTITQPGIVVASHHGWKQRNRLNGPGRFLHIFLQ